VQPQDEVVIVPYRDGPYLVRGPVVMRDQRGETIAVSRRPTALCRCGKSRIRPFCDGTHQLIRFQAPSGPELASAEEPQPGTRAPVASAEQPPSTRAPAPSNGQPAKARPQPAQAALALAQEIVNRALETAPQPGGQMSTAQPLIAGALQLLGGQRRPRAGDDAALFLIQGALQALQPSTAAAEEPAGRAVAELQRAVADLEEHHDDA
jgi:CDGSH-type Zn-finger protein